MNTQQTITVNFNVSLMHKELREESIKSIISDERIYDSQIEKALAEFADIVHF